MSQPFVGQIIMFGGNFAPYGWHLCDGSIVSISQYTTLYQLLGTTYGGDGINTFGLPDFRGRIPINQGQGLGLSNYILGQNGGTENVTLLTQNLPQHTHALNVDNNPGTVAKPATTTVLATETSTASGGNAFVYYPGSPAGTQQPMSPNAIGLAGSSIPHNNIQPVLAVTFCIALFGVFPTQN